MTERSIPSTKEVAALHTPGPWSAGEVRHAGRTQLVESDRAFRGYVCEVMAPVRGDELDQQTREANARLIAAAPDMLDALEWAMRQLEAPNTTFTKSYRERYALASETIAKARGEICIPDSNRTEER